jgi:four helix bundle protein
LADFSIFDSKRLSFRGFPHKADGMGRALCVDMSETSERLKARTEAFAVSVVKFCDTLPNSMAGRRIGQQLLDAGTSVAANYRAVCRAYTGPLFISKLAIVDEEADESEFWFRIIKKTGLQSAIAVKALEQEAHELASIFSVSLRTARRNRRRQREKERTRQKLTR